MASYNKIILLGHLTHDPKLSYLPSNTSVVEFGIATNRKWTSSDGTNREEVCFVDCRAFGKVADNLNKYCQKGRPLLVEGRLTFDQWTANDGSKKSKHRVIIENFTFVDAKDKPAEGESSQQQQEAREKNWRSPGRLAKKDDIPF